MTVRPVVMVVDDEIANIELIGDTLEQDYEVIFARSGEQAITLARKAVPDLILLDIVMPGMDGYETCRRIKQEPGLADVPVIFTTGLDAVEDEVRGLSVGAIDYVTKPVQPIALRRRVGNHVSLKQMRDRLASQAMVDPLTGLGNRRLLESRLGDLIRDLSRAGEWLSVIIIDIDYFKKYNDIYGHLKGDYCIRLVAGALESAMRRDKDFCTRYGGEEFACILPRTGLAGAMHIAEQMRSNVAGLMIPHSGSDAGAHVSISAGVVSRRCEPHLDMPFWIEQADRLLYESKRMGRDRVTGRLLEGP